MTDILKIKRLLAERAQAVAEMLLPGGRREGQEWRAGSVNGEKGQSLGVHLSGNKAGLWADFNEGSSGDLLDLWCAVKRISLNEALQEAKTFLGVHNLSPAHAPKREFVRPKKPQCTAVTGRVLDYLTEDRNIPQEVVARYRVAARGDEIIFPFLLPSGELALAKARRAEDGAKPVPTQAGCEPVLFGWQAIPDSVREVLLCEGEIDALSWAAYGFHAMSVPYGGGGGDKQAWIESEYDRLERFERIYIAMDTDESGEAGALEICSRLGRHRCFRVRTPFKDANECLVNGVTREAMQECVKNAESYQPEGLRRAGEFEQQVAALFWPEPDDHQGYCTPYERLRGKLNFRPGELTLWSGSSGSGKSQILSDCSVDWLHQGSRICLSSLEMKAAQSLKRMAKQAGNVDRPTIGYLSAVMKFFDTGLLIYERVGKAAVEKLLDVFDYARARYGCDQFIVDSLMRLGIESDDYNGQEKAVYELVDWTIANNVHLHLVAHARKGERGRGVPESEDVKGAMEIGANAFNILTIWRDRDREDKLKKAEESEKAEIEKKPGVILNVAKQRNGDFEGKIGLWFDQATYRYRSSTCPRYGRNYVEYSAVKDAANNELDI